MARPKSTFIDLHQIKLFIIKNPKIRSQRQIAFICGVSRDAVVRALKELNIPQRSKPINYVG